MRKMILCLAVLAAGGLFAVTTLTRSSAGPFTWDVNNTSFTTDASGVKWVNGSIALFSYYGGGSGYPVLVTSSPNGRVEMNALSFGATGNWLFYGDEILIGAGGISSASTSSDTMNISNNVVLGASQVWKRVDNKRDMRIYGNVSSAPDTVTDLTLDAQNEGGYFTLHGSNSYSGSLTLQGLVGLDLDYIRGPFSKIDSTRPVTVNNGTRFYLRNGNGYTQEISQLVLNGLFGLQLVTATTASPVKLKINSLTRDFPYSTIGMDLDRQLILPNEPTGLMGPYICGTNGWAFVNADGSVSADYFGDSIDDPTQWTTADRAVNVNVATVTAPAGMYMTNGVMRFGQTDLLNLNGGVLTLTQGGLTRCNKNTVISNGVIRSSAPNGALFVQTSKPSAGTPDFIIAAQIADNGSNPVTLVKAGGDDARSLYLSGNNTYSGGTYINNGRIIVNGGGNIGGGDLYLAPYDSIAGGSNYRLQLLNTVSATNRVRNIFAPASGIFKGGSTSAEVSLIVDGWATNLLIEANQGRFNYTLNGPSLVKVAQSVNSSVLNFTANNPQVSVGLFAVNQATSEIDFNSSITEPINCNAQFSSVTTSGVFRFQTGTWRMKNASTSSTVFWKGTNIIEGSSFLVFSDDLNNCNGDMFIRANGGLAVAKNGIGFASANATAGRNYVWDIRDNGAVTVSNGAFSVGGFLGASATVNQSSGTVQLLGISGTLSLRTAVASPVSVYNFSGGKLFIQNQLKGSDGAAASKFNWTGGELAFWAAYTSMLENGKLVNNGGVLTPGGAGLAAMSAINGIYEVASANAVLAIDIGGTLASNSRAGQDPLGYFDFVTGAANAKITLGGRLEVSLRSGFKPLAIQSFTILAINAGAGNELSGTFVNLVNGKVLTTDGQYTFDVAIDPVAYTVKLSNAKRNVWTGAAGDGNWMTPGNWSGGIVPSGPLVTALLDPIASDNPIALGQAWTLGNLVLDSKAGDYTLSGAQTLTLGGVTVSSGQHTLDVPVALTGDAVIVVDNVCSNAGLYFGRLDGAGSIAANPQTSIQTALTWAYTTVGTVDLTNSPWLAQNSQLIYSGYIWNNATTNATWSFAAQYDDLARLKINGVQLYDVGWNTFVKTNAVVYPGANSFELRLGNYSSGAGPMSGFGPVYDPQGRWSNVASDYIQFAEAGLGQLLTTTDSRIMLNGLLTFTKSVTAANVIKNGTGDVVFSAGADVQQLTLTAGRVSFAGGLTVHNDILRTTGTLDFVDSTSTLRLQKVAGVTTSAVEGWIADGGFSIAGKTVTDPHFYSVKDTGDGYITVHTQTVGTRIILR